MASNAWFWEKLKRFFLPVVSSEGSSLITKRYVPHSGIFFCPVIDAVCGDETFGVGVNWRVEATLRLQCGDDVVLLEVSHDELAVPVAFGRPAVVAESCSSIQCNIAR